MTTEQIEREYLAFCAAVQKDAMKIMAMATNGRSEAAADAAANLAQSALTQQNQYKMQQEQTAGADRYDLGALHVDTAGASNSETPFEE